MWVESGGVERVVVVKGWNGRSVSGYVQRSELVVRHRNFDLRSPPAESSSYSSLVPSSSHFDKTSLVFLLNCQPIFSIHCFLPLRY